MRTHDEYVIDSFQKFTRRDDSKMMVAGWIGAGVLTAASGNLLVGAVALFGGYFFAGKQILDDGKKLDFISESKAVAPFLDRKAYEEYVNTYGSAEADRQTIYALRRGLNPGSAALEGLEERHPEIWETLDTEREKEIAPGRTTFKPKEPDLLNASEDLKAFDRKLEQAVSLKQRKPPSSEDIPNRKEDLKQPPSTTSQNPVEGSIKPPTPTRLQEDQTVLQGDEAPTKLTSTTENNPPLGSKGLSLDAEMFTHTPTNDAISSIVVAPTVVEEKPLAPQPTVMPPDEEIENNLEELGISYEFLASLTRSPLQPVIIAGFPGSGKGVMAALALSIGARDNNVKFWIFNPKPKLEEAGYWVKAERHYLKNRLLPDPNLFADLMQVLEEFGAEASRRNEVSGPHQPFVLLIEEINAISSTFGQKEKQLFKSQLVALASLIRGCEMALWMSGQSVNMEDLGFTGATNRAMFTSIVALGPARTGVDNVCNLLGIPFESAQFRTDTRYYLTAGCNYKALPMPSVLPKYKKWSDVQNLIDLRTKSSTYQSITDLEREQINTIDSMFFTPPEPEVVESPETPTPIIEVQDDTKSVEDDWQNWRSQLNSEIESTTLQLREFGFPSAGAMEELTLLSKDDSLEFIRKDKRHDLSCIVILSLRKGEIKANDVYTQWHRQSWYKSLSGTPSDAVRSLFKELSDKGIGATLGEGERLTYRVLPSDVRRKNSKTAIPEVKQLSTNSIDSEVHPEWLPKLEARLREIGKVEAVKVHQLFSEIAKLPLDAPGLEQLLALLRRRGNVTID